MKSLVASIKRISEIINKNVDILDRMGCIVYSSDSSRIGITVENTEASLPIDGRHKLYVNIEGGSREQTALAQMTLQDKSYEGTADSFQQFLITILEGNDVSEEGFKKFNLPRDGSWIIYCVRPVYNEHFNDAYSLILNSFYENDKSWVLPYENDILILELADYISDEVRSNAKMIKDMINSEIYTDVYIGVGDVHSGIINIKKSLSEALEAINIGKGLGLPDYIYISRDMLAERVVSLIPPEKAKELADQVFTCSLDEIFDSDMTKTVEIFYKNNLNISDSSRILYIHRNTLLYRLDKIQKATGLDIRKFEDAVLFKIGLLLRAVEGKHEHKIDAKG